MRYRHTPNNVRSSKYQPTLWGDTYLTPLEAAVYLKQMLQTLKRYKDKTEDTK